MIGPTTSKIITKKIITTQTTANGKKIIITQKIITTKDRIEQRAQYLKIMDLPTQ